MSSQTGDTGSSLFRSPISSTSGGPRSRGFSSSDGSSLAWVAGFAPVLGGGLAAEAGGAAGEAAKVSTFALAAEAGVEGWQPATPSKRATRSEIQIFQQMCSMIGQPCVESGSLGTSLDHRDGQTFSIVLYIVIHTGP